MAKSDYLKAYKRGKAARENAKKKGVVTTQARKPKKKKKEEKPASRPSVTPKKESSNRPQSSQGSARRAGAQRAQKTFAQQKTQQTAKSKTTPVRSHYGQVQSRVNQPTTKVTPVKTGSSLSKAQSAYKAGQTARANQKNNGVVTTNVTKPKSNVISDFTKPKGYDYKKDLQKGYKIGSQTTYLGGKQKTTTTTLKTKAEQKKEYKQNKKDYYKSQEWKNLKNDLKTKNKEGWRKALSDAGWTRAEIDKWMESDEGKAARRKSYMESKTATVDSINKSIAKEIKSKSKLVSVDALTRSEFNAMTTAQAMGKEQGNKYLKSIGGEKLLEKIGSKNAQSAYKGKAVTGALQGIAPADVIAGSVGKNNKAAKEAIRQVQESAAYNVAYGIGQMAGVAASPTTAAGRALAKGVFKGAAKSTGRKLAENAAMDMAAEMPMNIADAVKMSRDENGNINKAQLATFLALNTALTGGAGAGMEALGVAATKRNVKQIANLKAKIDTGTATLKDIDNYHAKLDSLKNAAADTQAAKSGFAAQEYDKAYGTTRLSRGEGVELARLNAKKNSASGLTAEQQTRLTELTNKAADIAGENEAIIAKAKESLDTKTAALNTLSKTTGVKYKALNNDELIKTLRENGEDIDENAFVNGVNFVDKDGNRQILINKDSAQAHYTIVGHETTHLLEGSKEYDTLKSAVREFAESNNEYKELEEQMAKLYKNQTKGMSKEEAEAFLEEELTAEFVGRYLFREEVAEDFIRHLANKDRNLIQKIYDYLASALKNPSSEVEREQLQSMMKRFDDAFDDMGWNKGTKFKLSEGKEVLHAGKNSANDYLAQNTFPEIKQMMKKAENGDEKAATSLKSKTGWYLENGKWQFDIDMSNISFKNGIKKLAQEGEFGGMLGEDIGGIDALFKNYPNLEDAAIGFGDTGGKPYTLNIGGKNKALYGIVLNDGLVAGKKNNQLINDTLADALQDVVNKIDKGTIKRANEEDYAEELFDEVGYHKLASQSKGHLQQPKVQKKAPKKAKKPAQKQDYPISASTKHESFEQYKEAFSKKYDSMPESEQRDLIEEYGFHQWKDGDDASFAEISENFKKVLTDNGNPNPIKKTIERKEIPKDSYSWMEGVDWIEKNVGVSTGDANRYLTSVKEYTADQESMNITKRDDFTGKEYDDTAHVNELIEDINEYVEKAPAYKLPEGHAIYRGIDLGEDDFNKLVKLLEKMEKGDVFSAEMHPKPNTIGVPSSWSISRSQAQDFAGWDWDSKYSVLGMQHNNITGTPVDHISEIHGEKEVLFGTKCDRTFLGYEMVGDHKLIIHVLERAQDSAKPNAKYSLADMSGGDVSKLWMHNKPDQVNGKSVVDEKGKVTKEASTAYDKAVKSGDMKTAQAYVDAVLASKGYTYDAYHGSDTFGFTRFDADEMARIDAHNSGDTNNGMLIFASRTRETASTYTANEKVRRVQKIEKGNRKATKIDVAEAESDLLKFFSDYNLMSETEFREHLKNGDLETAFSTVAHKENGKGIKEGINSYEYVLARNNVSTLVNGTVLERGGGVYHAKLKIDNPLVVDAKGSGYSEIRFSEYEIRDKKQKAKIEKQMREIETKLESFEKEFESSNFSELLFGSGMNREIFADIGGGKTFSSAKEYRKALELRDTYARLKNGSIYNTRKISKIARDKGFDGVVFRNLRDFGHAHHTGVKYEPDDIYVVFKSEQFKSADPVTYKDDGSVIPLSERGTATEPDIRFSLGNNGMSQRDALVHKMDNIQKLYDDGKISGEEYTKRLRQIKKQIDALGEGATPKETTPTAKETPAKETQSPEPKPAEPTAGETAKAEPTAGDKATRPMDMQGVIERSRRRAGKKEMNDTAVRDLQTMVKNHGSMSDFAKTIIEDGAFGPFWVK